MSNAIRLTTPTAVPTAVDKPTGLPIRRGARAGLPFIYAVYPRGWEYVEGFGFLPQMRKIIAKAGCNGVGSDGRLSKPIAAISEKGGTVIMPEDSRLGDYQHYVRAYDTEHGGKWFVDFCQTATVLPTGEILWGVTEPDAWNNFRAHIRDSGIIPPLLAEIYEVIVVSEKNQLDQLADTVHGNPRAQAKYDKLEKRVQAMQDYWAAEREKLIAATNPTPIKSKKVKVLK